MQTYNVFEFCKVYHTKIPKFKGGHWRGKLTASLKLARPNIQRYKGSRVDVGFTNLQCPSNLQRLPYKDTKIQWWTLALQTYSVIEI